MSKHTPGPWTIEEYGSFDTPSLVIHKDSENRVCFMATPGSHGDPAVIAADARLIAAAPDMLEALRGAMVIIDSLTPLSGHGRVVDAAVAERRGRILAAIAKATT